MKHADEQIPLQVTGARTDFSHAKSFGTPAAAHSGFLKAAERMVDVSNWHYYAGAGSAKFGLTNNLGEQITGWAKEGLYFYINLPAPGPAAGDGLEWVRIEKMATDGNAETAEEFVAMTVRPVPDPRTDREQIAHFFSDAATSTFIISRYGTKVSAEVHGRNEELNNNTGNLIDNVRNTLVGLPAQLGFSGGQWKKLVAGFIEDNR